MKKEELMRKAIELSIENVANVLCKQQDGCQEYRV